MDGTIEVYSEGIFVLCVCTDIKNLKELEKRVNKERPSGIETKWKISENENFATGQTNPCDCEQKPGFKHYLLEC